MLKTKRELEIEESAYQFGRDWNYRTQVAAEWINPGSNVLDIGAGIQTLKELVCLRKYVPVDKIPLTKDTLVRDVSSGNISIPVEQFDVVVCLGILEYIPISSLMVFLKNIQQYANTFIFSYYERSEKISLWKNHLDFETLEKLLIASGLVIQKISILSNNKQKLYLCLNKIN